MEEMSVNTTTANAYACDGCGAPLVYKPGSTKLVCKHCGSTKNIDQDEADIEELDLNKYMASFKEEENLFTTKVVTCSNCEATPTVDENLKSMSCPYCGSPLVEANVHQERYIRPGYVAPFQIDKNEVNNILAKWVDSRWFAPNKLKRAVLSPLNLNGVYLPYWTYDAETETKYVGERGDAYYVTVGSGKNKSTERRVRWRRVSGTIDSSYDDILVAGSKVLDYNLLFKVSNWNTKEINKIDNSYLAGFITEKYQINLKQGFVTAKQRIESEEKGKVRRDIGGDEQRIHSMQTNFYDVTFKHILLPLYVSTFRYKKKVYAFYVNGSTGTIAGRRPYSAVKITLAVLAGISIIAAAVVCYYWIDGQN